MYRPTQISEMTTPLILQTPTASAAVLGVRAKTTYTDSPNIVYCNFKTYGGTDQQVDGIVEARETAEIYCWYRPDINSNCRFKRTTDNAVFEILGEPEDIEQRHQFLFIRLERIKGGV